MNKRTLLVAIAAALPGSALAQAVDTSEWTCSACPFQAGYEAEAGLGGGWVSDDSAKFGEWNGLDEKGGHVSASARGGSRSESGTYWRYAAAELGLDRREASLALGREGLGEASLYYDGIAHRAHDATVSPFVRAGAGRLALPSGWVRSGSTAGMSALASSLGPAPIGIERQGVGARLQALVGGKFEFRLDARREEQSGTALTYANLLSVATALPAPVDAQTDTLEFLAGWRGRHGHLRLSYLLSSYDNDVTAVTFDNPFTPLAPDTSLARLSMAPDNSAWQAAIDGRLRLPLDGALSFRFTDGSMEQDDAFLPVSTSAVLGATPLPRTRLDGEVDTSHYRVGLSVRPHPRLRGRAGFRQDKREDRSPDIDVAYVVGDSIAGGIASSRRYSYDRTRLDASGELDLFDWLQLGAGADSDRLERSNQATDRTRERRSFGRLRFRPHATVEFNAMGGDSYREASQYTTTAALPPENPLLRKFNQANRNRDFAQGTLTWSPLPGLSLAAEGFYASDDYERSPLGLAASDDRRWAGTVSWAVREDLTLYASGGLQRIDTSQSGQETSAGAAVAWSAEHEDRFRTLGGGLEWRPEGKRWSAALDYALADATGRIAVASASPLAASGPLPALESELRSLRLRVGYQVNERLSLRLAWAWEDYESSDWAWDGASPATIGNLLGPGASAHNYSVHAVVLSASFRFGGPGPRLEDGDDEE